MDLKSFIRNIPDYPKPGVQYKDINSLLAYPEAFAYCLSKWEEQLKDYSFDKILGIESRGFIFGSCLAYRLGKAFVPVRKKGKLPGECISQSYELEYGIDQLEIQTSALTKKDSVVLVDDVIATGGTMLAAVELVKKLEATNLACLSLIDLPELGGSQKIEAQSIPCYSLIKYNLES